MTKDLHVANSHDALVCKCPKHRSHSDHTHTKRCPLNAQEIYNCPTCQRTVSIHEVIESVKEKKATRSNIDHSTHPHENTPAARAACRKDLRAAGINQEDVAAAKKVARPKAQPPIKARKVRASKD